MNLYQKPIKRDLLLPMSASRTLDRAAVIQASTLIIASAPVGDRPIRRIWPPTTMLLGLGLTAAWVSLLGYLLGYGLVALIGLAI